MDWANIIGSILVALMFAIGVPLALRKREKDAPQKMEQFFDHLQKIGVQASLVERGAVEEKVGLSRGSGQRSEGIIAIKERNIGYINVVSVASQYGVRYFVDYLVRNPNWLGQRKRKKTRMAKRKTPGIPGGAVDINWKGDEYLSRELNYDYRLKEKLLQIEPGELKGGIEIAPEPKYEYARIRAASLLPSSDLFEAIDIIAGHIKSGW